jgi:hypothetical protein
VLIGEVEGIGEGALGALFEFLADLPVVFPDKVLGCLRPGIDELDGALIIVDQAAGGEAFEIAEQSMIENAGFLGMLFDGEENEGFPQFLVPRQVQFKLAHDHDRAKD